MARSTLSGYPKKVLLKDNELNNSEKCQRFDDSEKSGESRDNDDKDGSSQRKSDVLTRLLQKLRMCFCSSLRRRFCSVSEVSRITLQPETRPISEEQLLAEVEGIYASLVMVEEKYKEVDLRHAALARNAPPGSPPKLDHEQWQALVALHRTLLYEHHNYFLASQHPSATPEIQKLTNIHGMPARLWRHGIQSFLELLRNRLPESMDHMLAFIYLAYSMMTLLYETVPAFEETWIKCLGDLARYRITIEDDDIDPEVWTEVARQWDLGKAGKELVPSIEAK